jgi:hypothetical protein
VLPPPTPAPPSLSLHNVDVLQSHNVRHYPLGCLQTLVRLSVISVHSGSRQTRFGLLGPDSEVVVAPKVRKRREGTEGVRKLGKGELLRR